MRFDGSQRDPTPAFADSLASNLNAGLGHVPDRYVNCGTFLGTWYDSRMDHTPSFSVVLGDRGRLVLPAPLRRCLDLQPGERLIVRVDPEGGFRVFSARDLARRSRGLYRDLAPGRSLADELIAERREEARREDES